MSSSPKKKPKDEPVIADAIWGRSLSGSSAMKLRRLVGSYKTLDSAKHVAIQGMADANSVKQISSAMDKVAHETMELLISKIDSKSVAMFSDMARMLSRKGPASPQDISAIAFKILSEAKPKPPTRDKFVRYMIERHHGITPQSIATLVSTWKLQFA